MDHFYSYSYEPCLFDCKGIKFKIKKIFVQVLYNKLLTELACLSHTGGHWSLSFWYGRSCAQSVVPMLANISHYGPYAQLVCSYYLFCNLREYKCYSLLGIPVI